MNRSLRFHLAIVALSTVTIFTGCSKKNEKTEHALASLPPAKVRVQEVEPVEISSSEEVVGTVRAKLHATLEAKHSGRIEKLPLSLGDTVKTGELVARLDSAETAARVEQAQASLEHAERDWRRVSTLFEQQSATRADRDAAEARLRVAKAAAAESKASFGYAEVLAPFNGVVMKKWADVGDLATPGKPIVDIADPTLLQVEVDLPEGLSVPLKSGAEFDVIASGERRKAGLREIAPAFDPVTRTRKLKLDLAGALGIFPGQFVRVLIPLTQRKALIVPESAVVERGQLQIAFSLENQKARMRLIKAGRKTANGLEVLSGLKAGDVVVTEGAERLSDGQPLEVR